MDEKILTLSILELENKAPCLASCWRLIEMAQIKAQQCILNTLCDCDHILNLHAFQLNLVAPDELLSDSVQVKITVLVMEKLSIINNPHFRRHLWKMV